MKFSTRTLFISLLLGMTLALAACGTAPAETAAPVEEPVATEAFAPSPEAPAAAVGGVSFKGDILPIFEKSCTRCHGATRNQEGLSVHTYAALMAGSQNGPVILPGDAKNSELVIQIQSGRMPRRAPKLEAEKIQLIIDWVNQGALDN